MKENNEEFFYLTICFSPKPDVFGLEKIDENCFRHKKTKQIYYFSNSYDLGWGPENAYILDKKFEFAELMNIVLLGEHENERQIFAAISFIMEGTTKQNNFRSELIKFTKEQFLDNNITSDSYFRYFFVDSITEEWSEDWKYIELLRQHKDWLEIEDLVKEKINNLTSK